ncbi:MerR family transcriptional regulator [Chloroflexota bacterium]
MSRLFRVAQAARELGCSETFLREGEKRGKLPKARRDFNSWRIYTEKDLEQIRKLIIPDNKVNLS